jgi:hypothetical protein
LNSSSRFGLNAKSASSVLYDYYNPEARAVLPPATFQVKESRPHKAHKAQKAQKGICDSAHSIPFVSFVIFVPFVAFLWLKIRGVEGVALADVAGLVTFFEPAQALFGGSVCEGVGDDGACCAALDLIVADGARRA